MKLILIATFLAWSAFGQKADAPTAPTLPDELLAKYQQAQNELVLAQAEQAAAEARLRTLKAMEANQKAVEAMRQACGSKAELSVGQDGKPFCKDR